jgi:hypothetical protein
LFPLSSILAVPLSFCSEVSVHVPATLEPEPIIVGGTDHPLAEIGYGVDSFFLTPLNADGIGFPIEVVFVPVRLKVAEAALSKRSSRRVL